jgi:hypothetical protein
MEDRNKGDCLLQLQPQLLDGVKAWAHIGGGCLKDGNVLGEIDVFYVDLTVCSTH